MKKIIPYIFLILLLYGCATPYQGSGFRGGYSDTKLQDGIYRVSFKGNGYTNSARAADFALLHAAEVALKNDYPFFVVREEKDLSKNFSYTTPVTANSTGNLNMMTTNYGAGPVLTSGNYSGTTNYSGGQTATFHKPGVNLVIQCFRERPTDFPGIIYDASEIRNNLRSQYDIAMHPHNS